MTDDAWGECANCGDTIHQEEYDRTGTDDYCESCPDLDTDPRTAADRGYANEEEKEDG